jgi:hypothetical protein
MAAQASHHAPSGRFIRAYLLTWGLLAAGGLTYLASLAWQPQLFAPAPRPQVTEADPGIQAANKALAEVGSVRRVVTEIQKDLGRIKDDISRREAEEKAAQERLTRLEDRVTTMAATPVAQATPEPAHGPIVTTVRPRPSEKGRATAEKRQNGAEPPRAPTHIISVTETPAAAPVLTVKPKAEAPKTEPLKIETGSIAAPPAITFGEPEVTPARQAFAVQLAAGPSLDALRLSWGLLVERHGGALASLQPRFIAPRAEGGPYRLLAGPLPSKADADKVCAAMGVGKQGCFSTPHIGDPL